MWVWRSKVAVALLDHVTTIVTIHGGKLRWWRGDNTQVVGAESHCRGNELVCLDTSSSLHLRGGIQEGRGSYHITFTTDWASLCSTAADRNTLQILLAFEQWEGTNENSLIWTNFHKGIHVHDSSQTILRGREEQDEEVSSDFSNIIVSMQLLETQTLTIFCGLAGY